MTLKDTTAAISSPGSPDGISPCRLPDGETSPSGQEAVHVSRFRALDNERAMPTNDTSGPLFTALSPSAGLQRSLANRLRARMAGNGSPLFVLTWSDWDMPAGLPICRLRASAPRTSDSACGGWPTTKASDGIFHSPRTSGRPMEKSTHLQTIAQLAGWPSPMAGTPAQHGYNEAGNTGTGRKTVELLSGWPTPNAANGIHATYTAETALRVALGGSTHGLDLGASAKIAGWATAQYLAVYSTF